MFELRDLRYFVAVAERLNVTHAAEAIHISQPALSRQIQALERDLGVALFDRVGKRLELTAEGTDFLQHASALLEAADAVAARARRLAAGEVGYLRVGATPQTIEALLSRALARFRLSHPRVEVGLVEGANDRLLELVAGGGIHLAIAAASPTMDLDSRQLFTAGLLAVLPPDDRRRHQDSLEIAELAGDMLLLLKRGFMTRDLFDQAVSQAGVRPRALLESGSPHSLLALAQAGHGIAVVSSTVALRPGIDHAVPLLWQGRRIGRRVSAVWNPQRHRPAALGAFMDTLHATAQEVHPGTNDLRAEPPAVGELALGLPAS